MPGSTLRGRLALSSLPQHLRDQATVYVLDPQKGFSVARKGANGFHALVARTGDDSFRGTWPLTAYRDDILYPISWDAAGADAQLRVFLDAAQMQAKGTPPNELKKFIQERYKTGYYKAPQRAGVSYMLAPILRTEQFGYYAEHGRWPSSPDPFVIMHGAHGYFIQFVGVTERDAMNKEYADMLANLCKIKSVWCLPK